MRRTTPNCVRVAEAQERLMEVLDEATSQRVAEVLEPFVGDERKRRVKAVLAARLESVTAVMDAPHDPHNGSAVLRTCDAFGVNALHVIQRKEDFLASRRIARGSQRWVGVHSYRTTDEAVATLRASGHSLCGTHPEGRLLPEELKQIPRLALVLGNERWGIAEELAASCEHTVRIPMRGFAESLNVSVTAAILLQHATSDRPGDLSEAEQARLYARALVLTMPRAPEILAARGVLLASPEALRAARAELGAFTRGEPE